MHRIGSESIIVRTTYVTNHLVNGNSRNYSKVPITRLIGFPCTPSRKDYRMRDTCTVFGALHPPAPRAGGCFGSLHPPGCQLGKSAGHYLLVSAADLPTTAS